MKEINEKLEKLNEKVGRLSNSMENIKNHINFLKSQKLDYLYWEEKYLEYKRDKQAIFKKIDTLENAQCILLEIER